MLRRSQTATEYLIILAVVIVIALIVVGVMGGIPSIGGGVSYQASSAILQSEDIGILKYAVGTTKTSLVIVNNVGNSVRVNDISINGDSCYQPINLRMGEKRTIHCGTVIGTSGSRVSYPIIINWTDKKTGAIYTQSSNELSLKGSVVTSSLDLAYFDGTGDYVNTQVELYRHDFFELSFTIRPATSDLEQFIGAGPNFLIGQINSTHIEILFRDTVGSYVTLSYQGSIQINETYDVRFTHDYRGAQSRLYVDGVEVDNRTVLSQNRTIGKDTVPQNLTIGRRSQSHIFSDLTGSIYNVYLLTNTTEYFFPGYGNTAVDWKDTLSGQEVLIEGDPTEITIS